MRARSRASRLASRALLLQEPLYELQETHLHGGVQPNTLGAMKRGVDDGSRGWLARMACVAAIALATGLASGAPGGEQGAYAFAFFRGNGEAGVYLAVSGDALSWREANGGKPVLVPQVGGKLTRDPSLCRGPDGVYHMVWTTSWNDKGFGVAHSANLLDWSEQQFVPVNEDEPKARNTWAPEVFYDDATRQYVVIWATTVTGLFPETQVAGDGGLNHRIYATTTADFKTWSPKRLFYDGGFNVIDAFLFKKDGRYGMVVKDETKEPKPEKNLRVVWSEAGVAGPWGKAGPPFTDSAEAWAEGPAVIRAGDRWLVYYDKYNKGGYGAVETQDFKRFSPVPVSLPKGIRHGTVVAVDEESARRLEDGGRQERRAELREPGPDAGDSLRAELDIPYADNENPRQRLDLYLPLTSKSERPLPLVVFIHGGAFLAGDRKPDPLPGDPCGIRLMLARVASGKYAGASVGYRLSPEATWPAQIQDCKAAIRWLRANARTYGIDPARIGVMGTSAGGHLAAVLGTSGGVAEMDGKLGSHLGESSRVACVVDEYGPTDFLELHGRDNRSPDTPAAKLIGGPLPDNLNATRSASPLTYVAPDNPPFLIIHGNKDGVVSIRQSERLVDELKKKGVDVTFVLVPDGGHGGFRAPEIPGRITAFFDRCLK